MNRVIYNSTCAAIVVLTLIAGVVHGVLFNRWGPAPELAVAGEKLRTDIPERFGDWEVREDRHMPGQVLDVLMCSGYVYRDYVNSTTGQQVSLVMLVGPPGPISAHSPEICYSSQDYQIMSPKEKIEIRVGDQVYSFWGTTFLTNDVQRLSLRVYHGWSDDRVAWQATDNPRLTFGGKLLYKLQLSANTEGDDFSKAGSDPCRTFLEDLLSAMLTAPRAS